MDIQYFLLEAPLYSVSHLLFISLPVVFVVDSQSALPPWDLTSPHGIVTEYF